MRSNSLTRRLSLLALFAGAAAAAFVALGYAAPNQTSAQAQYAPANTSPPTISDTTPQRGQELTANPGTWTGDQPIVFTYQWLRCNPGGSNCVSIPGATQQTYTAQAGDVGDTLRVRVTGTNASGSAPATSAATSRVTQAAPPPAPGSTIPVTAVTPPNRLVPAQVQFSPNPIRRTTPSIEVRVRVQDTGGFFVSGALVFVRSTPLVTRGTEATTGNDGWATVTLRPRPNYGIIRFQDNLQIFVRTRKAGDPLFAGVSGRRLVQVRIAR
jgi:hypothetical protein